MSYGRTARRLLATAVALTCGLAGTLLGPAAAAGQADQQQQAHDAGVAAYVIGYPLVVMHRTQAIRTCQGGVNTLVHAARLRTSADKDVVTPNNDTIYSSAWLDLNAGPQRLTLPAANSERYFSAHVLDMYSNNIEVAHGKAEGPSDLYVVGPRWSGKAPAGARVVQSPTPHVWLLIRTFVKGPDDLTAARAFQQGYALQGPAGTPVVPPGTDCSTLPRPQNVAATGVAVFDELAAGLRVDPPAKADAKALRDFLRLDRDDPDVSAGLSSAVTEAEARIVARSKVNDVEVNGWGYPVIGASYGTDYLKRAGIALMALGALPNTEAMYYFASTDTSGAALTGAKSYRLHFPAGQLPPTGPAGFWSLTMYDATTRFLVDNPINRYALNSANPDLVRNADGSLDLYIQHDAPEGHEANWLPAPAGDLYLALRVYLPTAEVLDGTWAPPTLTVVEPG